MNVFDLPDCCPESPPVVPFFARVDLLKSLVKWPLYQH